MIRVIESRRSHRYFVALAALVASAVLTLPSCRKAAGQSTLVAGGERTCLLDGKGNATCWGSNEFSTLLVTQGAELCGTPRRPEACVRTPTPLAVGSKVRSLALGLSSVCALLEDGTVSCWGQEWHGILGQGDAALGSCQMDSGEDRDCSLDLDTGDIHCVDLGTRQIRTVPCSRKPLSVPGLASVANLTAVETAFCANTPDPVCWGVDDPRVLPQSGKCSDYNHCVRSPQPLPVEEDIQQVGWAFRKVLLADGRIVRLTRDGVEPIEGLEQVSSFADTRYWGCAVVGEERSVRCWGMGSTGQLGAGPLQTDEYGSVKRSTPIDVLRLTGVAKLSVDELSDHACALLDSGELWCWGENGRGQLGVGDTEDRWQPIQIPDLPKLADVAVGSQHTCALAKNGSVYCWGADHLGQVGASEHSCALDYVFDPGPVPCQRTPHRVTMD
jgi:Regulator of chromosome condensation (RCC1) repeat